MKKRIVSTTNLLYVVIFVLIVTILFFIFYYIEKSEETNLKIERLESELNNLLPENISTKYQSIVNREHITETIKEEYNDSFLLNETEILKQRVNELERLVRKLNRDVFPEDENTHFIEGSIPEFKSIENNCSDSDSVGITCIGEY